MFSIQSHTVHPQNTHCCPRGLDPLSLLPPTALSLYPPSKFSSAKQISSSHSDLYLKLSKHKTVHQWYCTLNCSQIQRHWTLLRRDVRVEGEEPALAGNNPNESPVSCWVKSTVDLSCPAWGGNLGATRVLHMCVSDTHTQQSQSRDPGAKLHKSWPCLCHLPFSQRRQKKKKKSEKATNFQREKKTFSLLLCSWFRCLSFLLKRGKYRAGEMMIRGENGKKREHEQRALSK